MLGNGSSRGVERPPLPGGGAFALASAAASGVAAVLAGVAGGFVCVWVCFGVCARAVTGWASDDGEEAAGQRAKKCAHG